MTPTFDRKTVEQLTPREGTAGSHIWALFHMHGRLSEELFCLLLQFQSPPLAHMPILQSGDSCDAGQGKIAQQAEDRCGLRRCEADQALKLRKIEPGFLRNAPTRASSPLPNKSAAAGRGTGVNVPTQTADPDVGMF